jgi:hypothetical protein
MKILIDIDGLVGAIPADIAARFKLQRKRVKGRWVLVIPHHLCTDDFISGVKRAVENGARVSAQIRAAGKTA